MSSPNEEELRDVCDFWEYEHEDEDDCPSLDNDVSKTIYAIVNNDLELLKTVLPTYKRIKDKYGYNLLHLAIYKEHREIFDYLLSIGGEVDIETKCPEGETPLVVALTRFYGENDIPLKGDYFGAELIRRGANVQCTSIIEPERTLLNFAIERNLKESVRLLIPRLAHLDSVDDSGEPPLHQVLSSGDMTEEEKTEFVSMLIYYRALVTPECINSVQSSEMLDLLYDYMFDEDESVNLDCVNIFKLFRFQCDCIPKLLNKITEIDYSHFYSFRKHRDIFFIKSEYLQWLLQKFPDDTEEILTHFTTFNISCTKPNELKNLEILFESSLRETLVSQINNCSNLFELIMDETTATEEDVEKFLMLLLSYGVDLQSEWIEKIYYKYGYSDLFKHLLMFDVAQQYGIASNILPHSIYNVTKHINEIITLASKYDQTTITDFLPYCSRPSFVDYCKNLSERDESIVKKLILLPPLPPLIEFARDASRASIVEIFSVKNSGQFYDILKRLPLPPDMKKLISFELPLF